MSFKDRMIRVFFGVFLLISQAVPAFAEKITLACSHGGDYITLFYTFDLEAKTVADDAPIGTYAIRKGTYAIEVTEEEIFWRINPYDARRYNRNTAQLQLYDRNGAAGNAVPCHRVQRGPL
jgi:hypothetical protein